MFFWRQLLSSLRLAFDIHQDVHGREAAWPQPGQKPPPEPPDKPDVFTPPGVPAVVAGDETPKVELPGYFDNNSCWGYRDGFTFRNKWGKKVRFEGIQDAKVAASERIGICVHQTAVKFSTSRTNRKKWEQRLWEEEALLRSEVRAMLGIRSTADIPRAAARLALHERFWKVPYHFVSLLNGDVLYNNDIDRYTYHGNRANGPLLGWAMEGSFPSLKKKRASKHSPIDSFTIETGRQGLRLAVLKAREWGAPIEIVQPHRNYSSQRAGDTGEEIWREIVLPVAKELDLRPDYMLRVGSGLQIPREWDDDALYDWKGKRIAASGNW